MIEVLSLGAGVQSTTVLLMSIEGELPKLDHAIFADTGWEPRRVYQHLERLKVVAEEAGINVHTVSNGNVKEDALRCQVQFSGDDSERQLQKGITSDGKTRWGSLPYFILNPDGSPGMVRRQCTYEYKIRPIEMCLRRTVLGLAPRQRAPKEPVIRQWRGISVDEWQRSRKSDHPWMVTWHPLVEKRITRTGCVEWLRSHGYPEAPRSACIGCPFHHDNEWRLMRDTAPEEWQDAVAFDRVIRKCGGMRGDVFLHSQRVPLDEVDLRTDADFGQLSLWQDECQGMCGV